MELAPFPCGRLPWLRSATSLHPSGCVQLCALNYKRSLGRSVQQSRRGGHSGIQRRMSATSVEPDPRLQEALGDADGEPGKRLLMIVNPYATTVSDRLRNLVVYALRGSYEVDAIDTEARDHATELSRQAAREGYDVVVAFGGDGTINEAVHGLAGSGT